MVEYNRHRRDSTSTMCSDVDWIVDLQSKLRHGCQIQGQSTKLTKTLPQNKELREWISSRALTCMCET